MDSELLRFRLRSPRLGGQVARSDGARGLRRRHSFAFSRLALPELCFMASPPGCQRAQGRPGAGWHPRSTVRRLRYKILHSGIQVKPNTRPSLRSGLTAYAVLSPGSDALLPPSPCGSLMRAPGWAAASPQDLTHRPRASGRHGFAVREPHRSLRAAVAHGFAALRCPSRQCCQRPPQPIPRFVTIAIRPSDRDEVTQEYAKAEFR